jgi:hypothetical protein
MTQRRESATRDPHEAVLSVELRLQAAEEPRLAAVLGELQ